VKSLYATNRHNVLHVRVTAVMTMRRAVADELPITFLGRRKVKPYLPIKLAIEWLQTELTHYSLGAYATDLQSRLETFQEAAKAPQVGI
jgi:hypothetical protein